MYDHICYLLRSVWPLLHFISFSETAFCLFVSVATSFHWLKTMKSKSYYCFPILVDIYQCLVSWEEDGTKYVIAHHPGNNKNSAKCLVSCIYSYTCILLTIYIFGKCIGVTLSGCPIVHIAFKLNLTWRFATMGRLQWKSTNFHF